MASVSPAPTAPAGGSASAAATASSAPANNGLLRASPRARSAAAARPLSVSTRNLTNFDSAGLDTLAGNIQNEKARQRAVKQETKRLREAGVLGPEQRIAHVGVRRPNLTPARYSAAREMFREQDIAPQGAYARLNTYGEPGSQTSKAAFGDRMRTATNAQMVNRAYYGYKGRGRYDDEEVEDDSFVDGSGAYAYDNASGAHMIAGQGGFFDDVLGGLKTVGRTLLAPAVGIGAQALNQVAPGAGTALAPLAMGIGTKILGTGEYMADKEVAHVMQDGVPVQAVLVTPGSVPSVADNVPILYTPKPAFTNAPAPMTDKFTESGTIIGPDGRVMRFNKTIKNDKIQYNNLVNPGSSTSRGHPTITTVNDETGDLIFSHNEYLHDITSTSPDFHTIERLELNPGLIKSFPLLSGFASKFQEYEFIQCIFHFKSLITEGNATAAGSVMLCPSYNPADADMFDKRSIENSEGSVSDKVTADLICGIECQPNKVAYGGLKYIRTVDIDALSRRMYDQGFLQVACQGVPAGLPIGSIYCSYQVRLSKMRVSVRDVVNVGDGFTQVVSKILGLGGTNQTFNCTNQTDIIAQNGASEMTINNQQNNFFPWSGGQVTVGGFGFDQSIIGGSQYTMKVVIPIRYTDSSPYPVDMDGKIARIVAWFNQANTNHLSFQYANMVSTVPITMGNPVFSATGIYKPDESPEFSMYALTGAVVLTQNILLGIPGQQGSFKGFINIQSSSTFANWDDYVTPGTWACRVADGPCVVSFTRTA